MYSAAPFMFACPFDRPVKQCQHYRPFDRRIARSLAPSIQSSICMNRRLGLSENGRRAKMVLFLGIFGFFRSRR